MEFIPSSPTLSTTPQSSPMTSPSCRTPPDGSPIMSGQPIGHYDPSVKPAHSGRSPPLSLYPLEIDGATLPPEEHDDSEIFYKPGFQPSPSARRHAKEQRDKMLKRHLPYPSIDMVRAAPLELRFAARFLGRGCQPEFTNNAVKQVFALCPIDFKYSLDGQKHEQKLDCGLSALSSSTLLLAFKAKQAAREAERQRLLLTAWEIEEATRFTGFLDALHTESKQRLISTESEVMAIKTELSARSLGEVRDDTGYFQAVYDDQLSILETVEAQTEKVANVLASRGHPVALSSTGPAESAQLMNLLGSPAQPVAGASNTPGFGNDERKLPGTGRGPLDIDDSSSDEGGDDE